MTVKRLDRGEYRKAKKTPEGWLKADGYLTRVGVFSYAQPDGTTQRELRLPEEVFRPESVQTFAQVPVTDSHPPEFLTGKNAGQYAVGSTGETIRRDGQYMVGPLTVWKDDAVARIDSGQKQELSLGYLCDLEFKPGVWKDDAGIDHPYDAVQRNIRGNHVAIVSRGRAGPEARIRLDAAEEVDEAPDRGKTPPTNKDEPTMVKKNIDGVDADVSEQAAQLIDRANAKAAASLADAKAKADAAEAEHQKAKAKADALADELKKKEDALKDATDPAKVQAQIKARVDLETKARAVLGVDAKLDALDTRGVHTAVLAKLVPELKLDAAVADAYVQGRFDMAIDTVGKEALAKVRNAIAGAGATGTPGTKTDEADAHAEMVKRNTSAWKPAQKSA